MFQITRDDRPIPHSRAGFGAASNSKAVPTLRKSGPGHRSKRRVGLTSVTVFPARHSGQKHAARLLAGGLFIPAALGRSGVSSGKREGDGATPIGRFAILGGYLRADRLSRVATQIGIRPMRPDDGWCDDPEGAAYNKPVPSSFRGSLERMWRDDRIYDVVLVLDYNVRPVKKNRGSAIFFHLAREGYSATEGCVAISAADMRRLLPRLSRRAHLLVRR